MNEPAPTLPTVTLHVASPYAVPLLFDLSVSYGPPSSAMTPGPVTRYCVEVVARSDKPPFSPDSSFGDTTEGSGEASNLPKPFHYSNSGGPRVCIGELLPGRTYWLRAQVCFTRGDPSPWSTWVRAATQGRPAPVANLLKRTHRERLMVLRALSRVATHREQWIRLDALDCTLPLTLQAQRHVFVVPLLPQPTLDLVLGDDLLAPGGLFDGLPGAGSTLPVLPCRFTVQPQTSVAGLTKTEVCLCPVPRGEVELPSLAGVPTAADRVQHQQALLEVLLLPQRGAGGRGPQILVCDPGAPRLVQVLALVPETRYLLALRIWKTDERVSPWSEVLVFESGRPLIRRPSLVVSSGVVGPDWTEIATTPFAMRGGAEDTHRQTRLAIERGRNPQTELWHHIYDPESLYMVVHQGRVGPAWRLSWFVWWVRLRGWGCRCCTPAAGLEPRRVCLRVVANELAGPAAAPPPAAGHGEPSVESCSGP